MQFQPKAWYDEVTCVDWAAKLWSEDVKEVDGANLVFLDNLDGQTKPAFMAAMKEACNSFPHFLTAECTDELQVVDGGVGREIKRKATKLIEQKLLEDTEFFRKWTHEGLSASEKRVFVTHIGFHAHKEVHDGEL